MDAYTRFLQAAMSKNVSAIIDLVRDHPEIHDIEGDEGGLIDIIKLQCPEFLEDAFVAGLSPDAGEGGTLVCAAVESDLDLIRLCLRFGADLERRNDEGETVLGFAASYGSLEAVRLLVEAGADVNAIEGLPDGYRSTALDSACSSDPQYDRPEIRAFLRAHGARRYSELADLGER